MKKSALTKGELSKLSREEKLKLLLALEEKKRRKREQRDPYIPNPGQRIIHESTAMERYVFSGNGAGKTTALANECIWAANGYNPIQDRYMPVPVRIVYVVDDPEKIQLKIIPEMRKWHKIEDDQLWKDGKPYVSRIVFPNGSFIKFLSHGMEPMKAESIEVDFLAMDEPPPYKLWTALTRGQREKGTEKNTLLVGTPLAAPWLRKDVYDPWTKGELPYVKCFRFDSDVNKDNLDWERQLQYFDRLSEKESKIRREGSFFDLEGLALSHLFRQETHVVKRFEWPDNWPTVVAIDPHPNKKHVACLVGSDREGNLYYIKELTSGAAPADFGRELRNFYKGYRVIDIICDSMGNTPRSGGDGNRSFIEVIMDPLNGGNRVRGTSFKEKNDTDFIQRIQQVLTIPNKEDTNGERKPKLKIIEGNNGIIGDIENVEWTKYKNMDEFKPKLAIENKDFLATLKYALATGIGDINVRPRTQYLRKKASPWGNSK